MQNLLFSSNPNGKLLMERFSTIQPFDNATLFPGAKFEILYKGVRMGTAEVVAWEIIEYRAINNLESFLEDATPSCTYRSKLARHYGENGVVPPMAPFTIMVLQYTNIDASAMAIELHAWWRDRCQNSIVQDNQHTNF